MAALTPFLIGSTMQLNFRMKQAVYHGILVNISFRDPLFPEQFELFAREKSMDSDWVIYGIVVQENEVSKVIKSIQDNMCDNEPWYAHLYNDEDLIVIYKQKVFFTTPEKSAWAESIAFGKLLGIPEDQLDFRPNRFQDEINYFQKENLLADKPVNKT